MIKGGLFGCATRPSAVLTRIFRLILTRKMGRSAHLPPSPFLYNCEINKLRIEKIREKSQFFKFSRILKCEFGALEEF
jgi:hypothetical protein